LATVDSPGAVPATGTSEVLICGGWVSNTVTAEVSQVGPALEEQTIPVVPRGKNDPGGGLQVIVPQPPEGIGMTNGAGSG
jgi:hypothetical protein